MPEANQSAGSRLSAALGRFWARRKRLGHWILALSHHLPAGLIVASLVTIGHHETHWLDAIDGYAFLTLGNLTAIQAIQGGHKDLQVPVVIIDGQSHEDLYKGRSPLDRCELARNLAALYERASPPKVLVIDLDLSPVLPSNDAYIDNKETDCQTTLSALLTRAEEPPHKPRITKTILMEPFKVGDKEGQAKIVAWREEMMAAGIQFGDPSLDVRYGLIIKIGCRSDSLAAMAYKAVKGPLTEEVDNCLGEPVEFKTRRNQCIPEYKELWINPSLYLSALFPVSVADLLPKTPIINKPKDPLSPSNSSGSASAVFFGSSYGEDDTYSTPLGTVYGVEVHAAAFMSLLKPTSETNRVLGFLLEIGYAVALGGIISLCWRGYYARRFSSYAWKRQFSPYVLLGYGVGLILFVLWVTYVSLLLLSSPWSLWLSPIPIAIGMLIESLFNGAVHEAVNEGYEQRQTLLRRLYDAHKVSALQFSRTLAHERRERPRHAHHLKERFRRFMYLDVYRLKKKRKYDAASLLTVRRLAFFAILGWGIWEVCKN